MTLLKGFLCFMTFIIASRTVENHHFPCTAVNPKTHEQVDLHKLIRTQKDGSNWVVQDKENNRTFNINICSSLITNTSFIQNVDNQRVGAIYINGNETFSIGEVSPNMYFQGEKLVLQYKNGSLCPGNTTFRKSTTISFTCDPHIYKEPLIFFIADVDECAYFFEWHTAYACAKIKYEHLAGLSAIFGIILFITLIVYCIGGCIYRSIVMYATGWRRIPHYGTFFYIKDIIITLFSSLCSKIPIPSFLRPEYSYIRCIDEENRLIDDIFVDN